MNNLGKSLNTAVPEVSNGRSLCFHTIVALAFFAIDAFHLGLGMFTVLAAAYFTFFGVLNVLYRAIKRQAMPKASLVKMGVYGASFVAVFSTMIINSKIAKSRADTVVAAVKQYKIKYSRYPDTLQALVPEFLPSVPLAKYTVMSNKFEYWRSTSKSRKAADGTELAPAESASLLYTTLPPFGRPTFNFVQDRWGYLD